MKIIAVCCLVFTIAFAFITVAASEDTCNVKGHIYKKGEVFYQNGECMKFVCNGHNSFGATGCPHAQPTKANCKYFAQDDSKPYPQCCPRFEC